MAHLVLFDVFTEILQNVFNVHVNRFLIWFNELKANTSYYLDFLVVGYGFLYYIEFLCYTSFTSFVCATGWWQSLLHRLMDDVYAKEMWTCDLSTSCATAVSLWQVDGPWQVSSEVEVYTVVCSTAILSWSSTFVLVRRFI